MPKLFAQAEQVVTTSTVYTWVNSPIIVALVFALSGAIFVSIYFLRRRKK